MQLATRLLALAAVAALGLATSACASRQTTSDSQTVTGPVASQPGGAVAEPGQPGTPGMTARNVPGAASPATPGAATPDSMPAGTTPGASLTVTTPGGPSSLTDVFFAFDESTLSPEARRVLEQNAEYLRRNPQARVQIEGHADERGSTSYNLALGDRRATAAKQYLVSLGIDPSRISTISFGEEKPFAIGQTEEAWAQNRRGHFVEIK
ncbi:MAG TPA: peptidoglycan-associated lipoprotein Pal [Thermodesulfobacteriota bacterium]